MNSLYRLPARSVLGIAAILLLITSLDLRAEGAEQILRGAVTDPAGLPVGGITVSLHQVSESGGAEVGRALTDSDGRFEIPIDESALLAQGVFFAATRFDGVLFMGDPFRSLDEMPTDYRIVIDGSGITGGFAQPMAGGPPRDQGWIVGAILALIGVSVVLLPLIRARRGPIRVRTTLTELAELEEAYATAEGGIGAEEYDERKRTLYDRLYQLTKG